MSTGALKKLVIEHLRGSVVPFTLPLDEHRKLTIIYGENGTGKTTICDAFEFLGKGKVGSLENRGLGKTNRYWHSVGKEPADITVSLKTTSATCTGRISRNAVVVQPPNNRPNVEVLRRSQILSLVEANPSDRYLQISRFIDVSGVEASETTLRDLIRNLKSTRETAVARVQENQDTITQFWEAAGKPGTDAVAWAEHESTRDDTTLQNELSAITSLRTAYQRLADYPERAQTSMQFLTAAEEAAIKASEMFATCLKTVTEGAEETLGILEAANAFLLKYPQPSQCPLCESTERASRLSERVTERMQQYEVLRLAKCNKQTAEGALEEAKNRTQALKDDFTNHVFEFATVQAAHSWPNDVPMPTEPCPADLSLLPEWLNATKALAEAWGTAEATRREKNQFLATLKKSLETYRSNIQAQKDLDLLFPRLKSTLEIIEEERRSFTDQILAKIANEVGRLYEDVHPGEGLNRISLGLAPNRRASLDMNASFCGQTDLPPQAYFSQSHLDTLGLCVFLALSALDSPADTILVLDDVLASVDEPHVERLIEMLYAEAMKFQHCIITTHYRPWKEKLRWGWLKTGQCHFIELTKWTNANGLTLTQSIPDVDRLRQLLNETPPDPQLVCAKAGVILEAALDFLTQLYECPVPRRANALYTIGDLLPSIGNKLRRALRVDILTGKDQLGTPTYETKELGPILDELLRIAQARNVFGCHFSALSLDLLESDAIAFGQNVLALIDILTDPNTGWPKNSKSGSYWATAGETRRLHPLKQPS